MSLRKAVNQNFKNCIFDNLAAGTWRQQVTLCSVNSCALYDVRPRTSSSIPKSVLSYYGIKNEEYEELKSTLRSKPNSASNKSKWSTVDHGKIA